MFNFNLQFELFWWCCNIQFKENKEKKKSLKKDIELEEVTKE